MQRLSNFRAVIFVVAKSKTENSKVINPVSVLSSSF